MKTLCYVVFLILLASVGMISWAATTTKPQQPVFLPPPPPHAVEEIRHGAPPPPKFEVSNGVCHIPSAEVTAYVPIEYLHMDEQTRIQLIHIAEKHPSHTPSPWFWMAIGAAIASVIYVGLDRVVLSYIRRTGETNRYRKEVETLLRNQPDDK